MWDQMAPLFVFLYIFSHSVSSGGDLHVGFCDTNEYAFDFCIGGKKARKSLVSCSDSAGLFFSIFNFNYFQERDPPLTFNHFNQLVFHGKCLVLDGDLLKVCSLLSS